jgi:hypothetical protein
MVRGFLYAPEGGIWKIEIFFMKYSGGIKSNQNSERE